MDIKDGRKKKMIVYHGAGYKPAIELAVQLRKHGIICEVMRLFQGKPIEEYIEVARKEGMEHICYFEDKGLVWMIITETGKFERIAGMDDLIK